LDDLSKFPPPDIKDLVKLEKIVSRLMMRRKAVSK
jgi:hypothetical protein